MKNYNLLDEIYGVLEENKLYTHDIRWVGSKDIKTTWEQFKQTAEKTDFHDVKELPQDLVIFANGWYLTIGEDNFDKFEITIIPKEPETARKIYYLSTCQSSYKNNYPDLIDLN